MSINNGTFTNEGIAEFFDPENSKATEKLLDYVAEKRGGFMKQAAYASLAAHKAGLSQATVVQHLGVSQGEVTKYRRMGGWLLAGGDPKRGSETYPVWNIIANKGKSGSALISGVLDDLVEGKGSLDDVREAVFTHFTEDGKAVVSTRRAAQVPEGSTPVREQMLAHIKSIGDLAVDASVEDWSVVENAIEQMRTRVNKAKIEAAAAANKTASETKVLAGAKAVDKVA